MQRLTASGQRSGRIQKRAAYGYKVVSGVGGTPDNLAAFLDAGLGAPSHKEEHWLVPNGDADEQAVVGVLPILALGADLGRWKGLHRVFGSLPATEAAFRQFADEWGLLGVHSHVTRSRVPVGSDPDEHLVGESIGSWRVTHIWMRRHLNVLDASRGPRQRRARLERRIERLPTGTWRFAPPWDEPQYWSEPEQTLVRADLSNTSDHMQAVREWLASEINYRLLHHAAPLLIPSHDGEIGVVPLTLLGVLYGLLGLDVASPEGKWALCAYLPCSRPFKKSRSDQRFHTKMCGVYHWRETPPGQRQATHRPALDTV